MCVDNEHVFLRQSETKLFCVIFVFEDNLDITFMVNVIFDISATLRNRFIFLQ